MKDCRSPRLARTIDTDDLRHGWESFSAGWIARSAAKADAAREGLLDDWMLDVIGDVDDRYVIDLGCGEGRFSPHACRQRSAHARGRPPAILPRVCAEQGQPNRGVSYRRHPVAQRCVGRCLRSGDLLRRTQSDRGEVSDTVSLQAKVKRELDTGTHVDRRDGKVLFRDFARNGARTRSIGPGQRRRSRPT